MKPPSPIWNIRGENILMTQLEPSMKKLNLTINRWMDLDHQSTNNSLMN
jgi:hypothetical protein